MVAFIVWIVCSVAAGIVGANKGRTGTGWTRGIILGPLGLLIIAILPTNQAGADAAAIASGGMRKCPYCAELVKKEAKICKHCGKEFL